MKIKKPLTLSIASLIGFGGLLYDTIVLFIYYQDFEAFSFLFIISIPFILTGLLGIIWNKKAGAISYIIGYMFSLFFYILSEKYHLIGIGLPVCVIILIFFNINKLKKLKSPRCDRCNKKIKLIKCSCGHINRHFLIITGIWAFIGLEFALLWSSNIAGILTLVLKWGIGGISSIFLLTILFLIGKDIILNQFNKKKI